MHCFKQSKFTIVEILKFSAFPINESSFYKILSIVSNITGAIKRKAHILLSCSSIVPGNLIKINQKYLVWPEMDHVSFILRFSELSRFTKNWIYLKQHKTNVSTRKY